MALSGYGSSALLGGQSSSDGMSITDLLQALQSYRSNPMKGMLGDSAETGANSILGDTTKGLGILGNLGTLFAAYKQLGLGKDILKFQKQAYAQNFNNEAQAYNNAKKDLDAARASGDSRYRALGEEMKKFGLA